MKTILLMLVSFILMPAIVAGQQTSRTKQQRNTTNQPGSATNQQASTANKPDSIGKPDSTGQSNSEVRMGQLLTFRDLDQTRTYKWDNGQSSTPSGREAYSNGIQYVRVWGDSAAVVYNPRKEDNRK